MPRTCPDCSTTTFDPFGLYAHPFQAYWEVAGGGSGRVLDPVDGPGGMLSLWTYGGPDTMGGLIRADGSVRPGDGSVIPVLEGAPQVVSFVLDTATGPDIDTWLASWGQVTNLQFIPYIGEQALAPVMLDWTVSPFDPDRGTVLSQQGAATTIGFAQQQVGVDRDVAQPLGIWGAAAMLPGRGVEGAYTHYALNFEYELATWDNRGVAPVPEVSSVSMLAMGLAALAWWCRRQGR